METLMRFAEQILHLPNKLKLRRLCEAALTSVILLFMCASADQGIRLPHMLPLLLLVGFSLVLNLKEDVSGKGSASSGKAGRSRDLRLDYLRFLAVTGVITIHAIDALFPFLTTVVTGELLDLQNAMNPAAMKLDAAVRTCCYGFNIVYIMLSGALLLSWKQESLRDFYLKRMSKVLLPLLIYFFFYQWQNGLLFPLSLSRIAEILRMFFTADIGCCPFYWLIYIIISLYLFYPFMRYMMKDLPYKALTVLAIGIILFSGIVSYTSFVFAPVIGFWLGYAILGYWVTRPETRRFDRFLFPMGLLQAAVIFRLVWTSGSYDEYMSRIVPYTPIMVFLCLGYFSFVYLLPGRIVRESRFLSFFGRYSFAVILIHWWMLYFILGRNYPALLPLAESGSFSGITFLWKFFASGGIFNSIFRLIQTVLGMHGGLVYLIIADVLLSLAVGALFEDYLLKGPLFLWDLAVNKVISLFPEETS